MIVLKSNNGKQNTKEINPDKRKICIPLFGSILFFPILAYSQSAIIADPVTVFSGTSEPNCVIGPYAYADNLELSVVEIPEGVEEIGEYAFLGCINLKQISLPSSLKKIGEGAFRECSSLVALEIPEGVREIPRYMCAWDDHLTTVILPESLTDIGSHAFAYCLNLKEINFPEGLTHIGSNAFSFDYSLTSVALPDSIEELESYAFSDCTSLRQIKLPSNEKMLGEYMLTGCSNLEEIICLSILPPTFDCNSPLFDPSESQLYNKVRLSILPSSLPLFKSASVWSLFFNND